MSAARSCCPYHLVLNCRQSRNYQDYSRCIFHYILQYLQVHVGGARSQDPHLHRQQDVREPSFHIDNGQVVFFKNGSDMLEEVISTM